MNLDIHHDARIMIVDDEPANVLLLEQLLDEWGYCNVVATTDSYQALQLYLDNQPHIVLLDLMMPGLDGFAVMRQLHGVASSNTRMAIIVLTADISMVTKRKALEAGAHDFLTKPFDAIELSLRLSKHLEINFLHDRLRHHNQELEMRVEERTEQLARSEHETAVCLGIAGEYRDDDTGRHTQRVGATAAILAQHCGLDAGTIELLVQAAPLHDVGKIGIPDSILLKPDRLTTEEFQAMKTHCEIGQGILSRHSTPLLQLASRIAISHHERWNGSGYPFGLVGEAIPIEGRIVALVDVFDALTHERPYKVAWSIESAIAEIQNQAGQQFDPALVQIFLQHLNSILAARIEG